MTRHALMLFVCLLSLIHHTVVRPCKEHRANVAGTMSCTALLMVAIVNMIRACFEGMEIIPTGSSLLVTHWLDVTEDCLLLWIPLAGIGGVFLVLMCKIVKRVNAFWCRKESLESQNRKGRVAPVHVVPLEERSS